MAMNPVAWIGETRTYLHEVRGEYNKITWPPQKEAIAGTVGSLVIITIVTVVLGSVDFALSRIMQLVLQ